MTLSLLSLSLAFLGGLVTVLSPCILPLLPLVVGRSLQSHSYGPIALVSGLMASFAPEAAAARWPWSWSSCSSVSWRFFPG